MSDCPSNTPKRQKIVERLKQRIDCFRKRHDSCEARLEETHSSREQKQLLDSRRCQEKILENKTKMNGKIRPEPTSKIAIKLEENECKSSSNAVGKSMSLQVIYFNQ